MSSNVLENTRFRTGVLQFQLGLQLTPRGSVIIIIMNISPRKLIQEPQMRSCSNHLSHKNVISNFRNESKLKDGSFILAGRSFQIVGPQTLNDLGPNVTVLVLGMYSCPEVADRNCLRPGIAETTMQSAAR